MTQLFVERLTATACESHAARVRRLLSGVADHGLDQALAGAGLASGDWCVRRVSIELRIDDRQTDAWVEGRWAQALVSALKQRITSHEPSSTTGARRTAWPTCSPGLPPAAPNGSGPGVSWACSVPEFRAARTARAAACAAARHRPELALAALVEAVERVGVVALHRMLGGDGWAELAAVVAVAFGVPGLPMALRPCRRPGSTAPPSVSPTGSCPGHGSPHSSAGHGCGWTRRQLVPGRCWSPPRPSPRRCAGTGLARWCPPWPVACWYRPGRAMSTR